MPDEPVGGQVAGTIPTGSTVASPGTGTGSVSGSPPVRIVTTTKRYIGLSSDTKPYVGVQHPWVTETPDFVQPRDIPAGSTFLESDTGRLFRYDGANWKYAWTDDGIRELLSAILNELRIHTALLEEEFGLDSEDVIDNVDDLSAV